MAIPIILGAAAVAAAATGLYKSGKAIVDNNKAGDINDEAQSIISRSEKNMEIARDKCQKALSSFGKKKVEVLTVNIQDFIQTFEQIKNVTFDHNNELGNLTAQEFSHDVLDNMEKRVSFIIESGLGAGGGALGGALTAYGAYSGIMAFGTASTGTAIGTLSGAAATNATLAWLGGGSIAAGGGGIALGTAVLSGVVAGPALLIAGWYMGSKAESKLNDAYSNRAQAEKFESDINAAIALTDGIRKVAEKASSILSQLRKHSRRSINQLKDVINTQGQDYSQYDDKARFIVMKNVKLIQLIKAVLDTPILDKDGALLGDADSNFNQIQQNLHTSIE